MKIGGELKNDVLDQLYRFLSYQERCTQDIVKKLYKLSIEPQYHDEYIQHLVDENYLSDERFARLFVKGKIKGNKWGKRKVAYALQQKQLNSTLIDDALNSFNAEEYEQIALSVAQKKLNGIKLADTYKRKQKVYNYLAQKGFEPPVIQSTLQQLEI